MENIVSILKKFVGQRVALLCTRFQYRGVLSEVHQDYVVLSNATGVEISGPCSAERPNQEDPINGSAMVLLNQVELIYQPNWVNAPLPGEE